MERFGGIDVLREAGLGNLRILPVGHRELIESPEGGQFRVLSGNSSYTSSRILTLDRLVDLLYPDADMPHGVLAAMPNRHEVGVHVIRDEATLPTLINLATFACKGTVSAPGPLSPNGTGSTRTASRKWRFAAVVGSSFASVPSSKRS